MIKQAGFGGGCHWCTEAVFQALQGVQKVEQGWIASEAENSTFSEAVLIDYDSEIIAFEDLIAVHLYTHSAASQHSMRQKYRSAVYILSEEDHLEALKVLVKLQPQFDKQIVTQVISFRDFKINNPESLNYYSSDPEKPFCKNYINPKLGLIQNRFSHLVEKSN